jgi:LPXTG-motif cell wall-anchored protein
MAVRITRSGVGLTIGIIILGLVVLGGLTLVKQRGEQARRDEAVKIAQQNLESQSTGALSPGTDSSNNATGGTSGSTTNGGSASTDSTNAGSSNVATNSTGQLPQTGPSDFTSVLAIGALTFAAMSYMKSRRTLFKAL